MGEDCFFKSYAIKIKNDTKNFHNEYGCCLNCSDSCPERMDWKPKLKRSELEKIKDE